MRLTIGTALVLVALAAPAVVSGATGKAAAPPAPTARVSKHAESPKSEDCLACHADHDLKRSAPRPGRSISVFVDAKVLDRSTHAGLQCVDCHTSATPGHDPKLPPVRCAGCHDAEHTALAGGAHGSAAALAKGVTCSACHGTHDVRPPEKAGPDLCAGCHPTQVERYRDSIHGRARQNGISEAATCQSCHGTAHTLLTKTDPRAPTYHLNLPRTCAQCHANADLARRYKIEVGDVYKMYLDSIHGRAITRSGLLVAANCSDCHGAHDIKPRTDPTSRVFRANVPATCGSCHAGVLAQYRQSIHGKEFASGNPGAPICIDCHSAHQIRRVEAESWKLDIIRECGTCHAESLRTYRDTFHGKVTALGFTRVARCSDCHGAHTVLPVSDPASSVSPTHVVATCGKCHPNANANFARYDPHADPANIARSPLLHYTWRFMTWLLVGTFGFFGVHTVLWGVRSLVGPRRNGNHRQPPREEPPTG